jgi:signal transduction histidine kinase
MDRTFRPVHTGSDADIAFAVLVLASYFSTFSAIQSATTGELLYMIALGVGYIAIGIYGYAYVTRSGRFLYALAYFATQVVLGGMIVYLGRGVGFNAMVLLPLAGHSVVLMPYNWRLPINLCVVAAYVVALNLTSNWAVVWSSLPVFLAGQIFIIVFTQMAVNEERARSEVEKLARDLSEANQTLRSYALQAEELAIAKERNRLAREIHDGLGHYLTTVYMQIQAARAVMKIDSQKAMEALTKAQNLAQEALVDVRQSVSSLRDSPGSQLPLPEEIDHLLHGCEAAGIQSELKVTGSPRVLSPQSQLTVFRAVQEGVNNACKHSRAKCLWVMLDYSQNEVVKLVVQDDGIGASEVGGGFGLVGMRERVNLLSGQFSIVTAPGQGFRFEVSIPG